MMQKAHTILLQVPASQQSKENMQGADETDSPAPLGNHDSSLGNLHSAPTVWLGISGIQVKIQARFSRVYNLKTFWGIHIRVCHSSKSYHLMPFLTSV